MGLMVHMGPQVLLAPEEAEEEMEPEVEEE